MRIKASSNTSLSTATTSVNFGNTDFSRGSGLTAGSTGITIGAGITVVKISAAIIADGGGATYLFSRIRRNRSGVFSEISQQINGFVSSFASNSQPPMYLSVQSGDIIDVRADVGTGTATLSSSRPQWLQVEAVG